MAKVKIKTKKVMTSIDKRFFLLMSLIEHNIVLLSCQLYKLV